LQKYQAVLRQLEESSTAGGVQDEPEVAKLLLSANAEAAKCIAAVADRELALLEVACVNPLVHPRFPCFPSSVLTGMEMLAPQVSRASLAEIVHRGSHTVTEITRKRSQEESTRLSAQRAIESENKKLVEMCEAAKAVNVALPALDKVLAAVKEHQDQQRLRLRQQQQAAGAITNPSDPTPWLNPWLPSSIADSPEYISLGRLAVAVVRAVESLERARSTIAARHESHFGAAADKAAEVSAADPAVGAPCDTRSSYLHLCSPSCTVLLCAQDVRHCNGIFNSISDIMTFCTKQLKDAESRVVSSRNTLEDARQLANARGLASSSTLSGVLASAGVALSAAEAAVGASKAALAEPWREGGVGESGDKDRLTRVDTKLTSTVSVAVEQCDAAMAAVAAAIKQAYVHRYDHGLFALGWPTGYAVVPWFCGSSRSPLLLCVLV
jgi:hypothetical protein